MTRVLVVDDEIDTLNLLRTILEISGYEAFTTLNSVDAITLADVERPDLILLDIMMPKLDGFTLCKMMRLHPVTAKLPIVFVTAYSALDIEDRRREAGADMVLPKPIGMDALIEAIEKATKLGHQSQAEAKPAPALDHNVVSPQIKAVNPAPVAAETKPVNPGGASTEIKPSSQTPMTIAPKTTQPQQPQQPNTVAGNGSTPPKSPDNGAVSIEIKPDQK